MPGEVDRQIDVIQDGVTESLGIAGKPRPGVGQDLFEIR
jgi:hypothetical protein